MSQRRRPGTVSTSGRAGRQPLTLDSFVQAAIVANAPATQSPPKKSRRRRKKQQKQLLAPISLELEPAAPAPPPIQPPAKSKRRRRKSKFKQPAEDSPSCNFRVRGLVSAEELEEEDEAEEVENEIRADFCAFGELKDVAIVREGEEGEDKLDGDVIVKFQDADSAASAFVAYDGKVFGGKTVMCIWETSTGEEKSSVVVVNGMLTPEELEEPEEVADVEEEMMQLFGRHGEVKELRLSEETGDVTVIFDDEQGAEKVVQAMNGSKYGGRLVTVSLAVQNCEASRNVKCVDDSPAVIKRIAAPIVQPMESAGLQDLVVAFLKRLDALQERAHTHNRVQDKRSRRFVLGMHEVRRGLLCNKIVLLVVAADLDGCEAVEEKHSELKALAMEQDVPILAPMNRRKLGRVLRKNVRVSCMGVYSVEGANDLFKQILQSMKATLSR